MNISRKTWLLVILFSLAGWWLLFAIGYSIHELFKVLF